MDKVVYICDRRKCEECNIDCIYTFDINHAKNFEKNETGEYVEVADS